MMLESQIKWRKLIWKDFIKTQQAFMLMHSFKTRGARRNAFAAPYS